MRSSGCVVSMGTCPDSDGDEIALRVAADSSRWQPPTANLVTREENQQTLAAPQYDNQEFQQTHAAETALRQAWDSGVTPLLPSVERTTDHHRRVNAHPLAAGVAEAGLHQAQESPVPAGTLPPGNQLQVQQPLLLRQTTQITQPVHRAAGARSTGPPVYYIIEKQPPRARRAASAGKQVLTRKQKTSARNDDAKVRKVSAEQKRGTRLASSFGLKAPEQPEQPPPRQLPAQHHPSHYCHPPQQHGFPTNGQLVADPALQTITATVRSVFSEVYQLGPAGFAQLVVAVERADRVARRHVVREQSTLDYDWFADKYGKERGPEQTWAAYRPAANCAAQPPPKLLPNQQPSLAPSSSTTSSTASASPPPSRPPSISSPPGVARRVGPWTPQESVELMEWLLRF